MSTKKTDRQPELSKIERQRREREARIAQLRDKDGGKKKIRTGSRAGRIALPIVAVLLILGITAWALNSFGVIHRQLTAVTVSGEAQTTEIGIYEYNYHYQHFYDFYNYYAQQGIAPKGADGRIDLNAASGMAEPENSTWGEFIRYQAEQSLKQVVAYSQAAQAKGLVLTEKDNEEIEAVLAQLRQQYPTGVAYTTYLESQYGRGMSEAKLRSILEREKLANQYATTEPESYSFSDEELETYYQAHKDDYDFFTYREFRLEVPKAEQGASQADVDKLREDTKAKADEMLGKLTDFDSMKDVAPDYAGEDKPEYVAEDKTLMSKQTLARVPNLEMRDWLKDEARQQGDKTVIESGNSYLVVSYGERGRDEDKAVHVRHILFGAREEDSDEKKRNAKARADEVAAKIQSEEDMVRYSSELAEDPDVAEQAEYKDVLQGQMVEPFDAWLYDPARKVGDVDVVKTVFGEHVMFFAGRSELSNWATRVTAALRTERFAEASKALLANYELTTHPFALRFAK